MRKKRRNWTQEEIHYLKELVEENISTYQIGLRLNRDAETVRNCMVKYGLPRLSRGRALEKNYFWNGGVKNEASGYILVKKPDHPYANSEGYVREHRLVMEIILNRFLLPTEVVHHKDHNRRNNNPDNLMLYKTNGDHVRAELKGIPRKWTPEWRENIRLALARRHKVKPHKLPFDRSAWSKARQRNANGEFVHQIPVDNG